MIAWAVWRGSYSMDKVLDLPEEIGFEVLDMLRGETYPEGWTLAMIRNSIQMLGSRA